MIPTPDLTEGQIRGRASEKSWARGRDYVDLVSDLVWRDGELSARVEGSGWAFYRVVIAFVGNEIASAHCSCPYDWGGDCKHIVATLLAARQQPARVAQRPALAALLAGHSAEALAAILTDLTARHPHLIEEIEALAALSPRSAPPQSAPDDAVLSAISESELSLLQRQIRADMRSSVFTGYDSWGDEAWYESDPGEALEPALARIRALLEADEIADALIVLRAATEAWEAGTLRLDEYLLDHFSELDLPAADALADLWAEALLRAELDENERQEWAAYLDDKADSILGGDSFQLAVTAAKQGWDYPPLVGAMGGDITALGAWEDDDVPHYAEALARIRLEILAARGDYEAYLNLAQAEGQFIDYLKMLVQLGRREEALAEARAYLVEPAEILDIAQTLLAADAVDDAISLAQHGMSGESPRGKAALATWLRDVAGDHGQPGLALVMAQQSLALRKTLANYQALQRAAGDDWPAYKKIALQMLASDESLYGDEKVTIYLYEQMHDEAIAAVDKAKWFHDDNAVIDAVRQSHPQWAFDRCRRHAEQIMDAGKAQDYEVAAEWLRRGRDILVEAGDAAQWRSYLDRLLDRHQRKYKLRPMLEKLRL
ncbi:MAG: SWIM zinc finger domain-containing protein [Anaerolineales bacterium]|nr:SWIM zinc finger domain-containing protein [Anaerolineales bacterium]MCB9128609.1 SWIM zinc finger domain-containing protein [Ardenticatenales bacterium]MCB9172547.1 SWIM zinc finger domain-containing protein [Ardenticatenales bacterium]